MTEKVKVKVKFLDGSVTNMNMDADVVRSYQRMDVNNENTGMKVKVRRIKIDGDGVFHFKEEKVIEGNIP